MSYLQSVTVRWNLREKEHPMDAMWTRITTEWVPICGTNEQQIMKLRFIRQETQAPKIILAKKIYKPLNKGDAISDIGKMWNIRKSLSEKLLLALKVHVRVYKL